MRRPAAAALAVGLLLLPVVPAGAQPARLLFRLSDDRIDEASGLAVGRVSPSVLYVENDSGDSSRFFALDRRTGRTVSTIGVPGAPAVDREDIATAPDAAGMPSVWLADIGDNDATRHEVQVYRVDEPRLTRAGRNVTTARPDVWRLRYPDGPTDAESLAVTPDGTGYIVTKSVLGESVVYRMPARPDPGRVQLLARVATIRFALTGTAGGPNPLGQLTATSAGFSADGSVLAVRTYTDAYVWSVAGGDVGAALRRPPTRVALPAQPQGEGIAVDGRTLLVDSETVGSAVYAVPLPVLPSATPSRAPSSPASSHASASASPSDASSPAAASRRPTTTSSTPGGSGSGSAVPVTLGVAGAAALVVTGAVALRRRRRRPR